MGEILMKIVGFIVDVFFLLGLIWLIVLTLVIILRVNFGRLLWLDFGVGSYTIKGRITFNDKSEAQPQVNICSDPMKRPPRESHYSKPVKPKKHKPEWWRFLTEESIGSLLEKHFKKKAEANARKKRSLGN